MRIHFEPEGFQPPRLGLLLLQCLVGFLFFLFVVRFWFLQVHQGEEFAQLATKNRLRVEETYTARGLIYDRNGVLLAENRSVFSLALIREDCRDIPATLAQVAQWKNEAVPDVTEKYIKARRHVKTFEPLILIDDIPFELLATIESDLVHWPGLEIITRLKRNYPQGPVFAHILGYVAEANERELEADDELSLGDFVGRQGLEKVLEDRLRGQKGLQEVEVNVLGRTLNKKQLHPSQNGEPITLALDSELQQLAWDTLGEEAGSIIVMEPDTAKVLALVTSPSFNNNAFAAGLSQKAWAELRDHPRFPMQNRAIQSVYPPASIWKLMMTGLFLKEGIDPKETVYCNGRIQMGRQTFRCWRKWGHGKVNMDEAVAVSCDVYYYLMADRLGIDKIESYAKACGFGEPTGIALPHEKGGLVPSKSWKVRRFGESWQRGETLNTSIGQGFTLVTPLQVANFICSLLNGGKILRPKLLLDEPAELRGKLPMTQAEREFILNAMRRTVEAKNGTAKRLRRSDAIMGGKTGTAQVVRIVGDKRLKAEEMAYLHRDHAWMAAWGVKEGKSYVVVCMVEHGGGGAAVAGPMVQTMFTKLFGKDTKR